MADADLEPVSASFESVSARPYSRITRWRTKAEIRTDRLARAGGELSETQEEWVDDLCAYAMEIKDLERLRKQFAEQPIMMLKFRNQINGVRRDRQRLEDRLQASIERNKARRASSRQSPDLSQIMSRR